MGCNCSRDDVDTDNNHQATAAERRHHRLVGVADDDQNAAEFHGRRRSHHNHHHQRAVSSDTAGSSRAGDDDDDAARAAQEEADFMLAQMLFQEQLAFIERQRRLEQERDARPPPSPTVPGLSDTEFSTVGRVMRFDLALTKKDVNACHAVNGKLAPSPMRSAANSASSNAAAIAAHGDGPAEASLNSSVFYATEAMECPLCMDDLAVGCELRTLYCGHVFHKSCIDDWLRRKRLCPMCQQDVTVMIPPPPSAAPRHGSFANNATHEHHDGIDDASGARVAPLNADAVVEGRVVASGSDGGDDADTVVGGGGGAAEVTVGTPVLLRDDSTHRHSSSADLDADAQDAAPPVAQHVPAHVGHDGPTIAARRRRRSASSGAPGNGGAPAGHDVMISMSEVQLRAVTTSIEGLALQTPDLPGHHASPNTAASATSAAMVADPVAPSGAVADDAATVDDGAPSTPAPAAGEPASAGVAAGPLSTAASAANPFARPEDESPRRVVVVAEEEDDAEAPADSHREPTTTTASAAAMRDSTPPPTVLLASSASGGAATSSARSESRGSSPAASLDA